MSERMDAFSVPELQRFVASLYAMISQRTFGIGDVTLERLHYEASEALDRKIAENAP